MAGGFPNCLVAAPKGAFTPGNLPKAPALSQSLQLVLGTWLNTPTLHHPGHSGV